MRIEIVFISLVIAATLVLAKALFAGRREQHLNEQLNKAKETYERRTDDANVER